jgi:hypothetical protein
MGRGGKGNELAAGVRARQNNFELRVALFDIVTWEMKKRVREENRRC